MNVFDGSSFLTKRRNHLSLVKFQVGEKTELDRLGRGRGVVVFESELDTNEIGAMCCLPSQSFLNMAYSDGTLVCFDLNTGAEAGRFETAFLKTYWMEQIDQHCFVTMSTNQAGAMLYDQRDLTKVQRRFSFGPTSIRVSSCLVMT